MWPLSLMPSSWLNVGSYHAKPLVSQIAATGARRSISAAAVVVEGLRLAAGQTTGEDCQQPPPEWTAWTGGGTMSAVSIAEAWRARGRPFTVADLDRLPDDGRRYELLDGVLIVSPRPTTIHQWVAGRLARVLDAACPVDLCVVPGPAVEIGPQTEPDPDPLAVHVADGGG